MSWICCTKPSCCPDKLLGLIACMPGCMLLYQCSGWTSPLVSPLGPLVSPLGRLVSPAGPLVSPPGLLPIVSTGVPIVSTGVPTVSTGVPTMSQPCCQNTGGGGEPAQEALLLRDHGALAAHEIHLLKLFT